jgi:hypothetical protein
VHSPAPARGIIRVGIGTGRLTLPFSRHHRTCRCYLRSPQLFEKTYFRIREYRGVNRPLEPVIRALNPEFRISQVTLSPFSQRIRAVHPCLHLAGLRNTLYSPYLARTCTFQPVSFRLGAGG